VDPKASANTVGSTGSTDDTPKYMKVQSISIKEDLGG
jgi:hypothetical protein